MGGRRTGDERPRRLAIFCQAQREVLARRMACRRAEGAFRGGRFSLAMEEHKAK